MGVLMADAEYPSCDGKILGAARGAQCRPMAGADRARRTAHMCRGAMGAQSRTGAEAEAEGGASRLHAPRGIMGAGQRPRGWW